MPGEDRVVAAEFAWLTFWQEVHDTVWVVSAASSLASLSLVGLYAWLPRWRKTPGWLMQRAICCDLLAAISFLSFCAVLRDMDPAFEHHQVSFEVSFRIKMLLMWMIAAETGANAWRLVMYLHLVVIYRNPFNPDRCSLVYVLVVALLVVVGVTGCVAKIMSSWEDGVIELESEFELAIAYPVLVYPGLFVLASGCVQLGVWSAIRADRKSQSHASVSYAARGKLIRHGLTYLSLHVCQLTLGLTVLGLLLVSRWRRRWQWHAVVVLLCGRPLVSHLGWFLLNGRFGRWLAVFWWEAQEVPPSMAPSASRTGQEAASNEAGPPRMTVQMAELNSGASDAAPRSVKRRMTAPGRSLAALAATADEIVTRRVSQGMPNPRIGAADFMSELRFEVLYDVARSIGDSAQKQLQQNALHGRAMPLFSEKAKAMSFAGCSSAAPSWPREPADPAPSAPVLSSAGLLSCAQRSPARLEGRPTQRDVALPGVSSSAAEHHEADDFAAIREAFDISPEQYARDFPNDLSRLNSRWVQKLRESVSEGASGSFFYRVLSDSSKGVTSRFIVKEISRGEKTTLMRILPAYRRHVLHRGGRSFIQYFGCHSVPLRWKYAARVHFVVMRNFLPVPMWLVFDLKGATANRRALNQEKLLEVTGGGGPGQRDASYGTLRDWEWMDINMVVDAAPEDKVEIAEILRADSEFLNRQGLLDYSLLVGIHRLPQESTSSSSDREERIRELLRVGGYLSLDRQKVYFFGIIDVLEAYSLGWRAQHAALKLAYHLVLQGKSADGMSAMKPELYADRFYTFMLREMLQWEDSQQQEDCESADDSDLCDGICAFRAKPAMGIQRWGKLWRQRRRGLVRERMEAERADFLRRIEELEQELEGYRREAKPFSPGAKSERQVRMKARMSA